MKTIYNIIGYKGSGKDTVAGFISEKISTPVVTLSFAYSLKMLAYDLFRTIPNITHNTFFGNIKEKETIIKDLPITINLRHSYRFLEKHTHWTGRLLLQYLGTEVFREIYPTIWVDKTKELITENKDANILITDCRFKNEYDMLIDISKELNKQFIVIRVTRHGYGGDNHSTEKEAGEFKVDYTIENNGSIKDLKKVVLDLVK